MRATPCIILAALLVTAPAQAGSNLPADDPAWNELRDAIAQGRIADPLGGVQSIDEDRARQLLSAKPVSSREDGWGAPLERATLRLAAAGEHDRPYSLPLRPRGLAGFIGVSCEYQEGRPCGDGVGAGLELDSAAGWSDWLTLATRVRASAGTPRPVPRQGMRPRPARCPSGARCSRAPPRKIQVSSPRGGPLCAEAGPAS